MNANGTMPHMQAARVRNSAWFALALWSLFAATTAQAFTPAQASFRVRCPEGGGMISYGSGTAISPNCVVTNSHVVGGSHRNNITIIGPRGENFPGQTVVVNPGADIALVWCPTANLPYVDLAATDPKPGEPMLKMGYGGEGQLMKAAGTCQGVDGYIGGGCPVVASTCVTVSGDSGGGNFNAAGELCSVTWGSTDTNGGHGRSTPASVVRQIALEWQTQFCPNGACPPIRGGSRPRQQQPRGGGGRAPVTPDDFNPAPKPPENQEALNPDILPPDPQPPQQVAPVVPVQPPPKGCDCDHGKLGCKCDESKLHLLISSLESKVDALAKREPQKGEPGPPGPAPDAITIKEKIEQAIHSKLGVAVQNKTQGTGFLSIGVCAAALVGAVVLLKK